MKLIKLNSYISESFINIDTSDFIIPENCDHGIACINIISRCEFDYDVYLNSYKIHIESTNNDNPKIYTINDINDGYVRVYINSSYSNFINFDIHICDQNDKSNIKESYSCSYTPSIIETDSITSNMMNDIQSSYMMIRTNPKLSGNIKLVIDSNENLYLDTFKVNNELSQKKYRKRSVSTNSYYSNDIRNIFKSISSDSLYAIPSNGNNLRLNAEKQIIDMYNYGVKLNTDRIYSENFSLLAPIWINENLPDYFVIFKVNNFKNNDKISSTDRLNYCIENGSVVKFFDMRRNSKIGKYLRNHQSEISNYMTSAYISRSNENNQYNLWYGISIDNGIITDKYESVYNTDIITNQVEYDNFITLGYERNRILNPYLINLEFLFNDENSEDLSINQYIGFFIYNYEFDSIYNINNIIYNKEYKQHNLDILHNTLFNDVAKNKIFNITLNSINTTNFYRITSHDDINNVLSSLNNIPYKNILNCKIDNYNKFNSHPQFITIKINKPIQIGEHIRIIDRGDLNNNSCHNIYEVISSNSYSNECSIIYENASNLNLKCSYGCFKGYDIYNENDKNELIKQQIIEIVNIFNSMNNLSFKISSYSDNSISFMSLDSMNDLVFERITNNSDTSDDVITYFNNFIIPGSIIKTNANYDNDNVLFTPINFEVWDNRKIYIVNFINYNNFNNSNTGNSYSYSINKKYILNELDKKILAIGDNKKFISVNDFKITYRLLSYNDNNDAIIKSEIYTTNPTNIIISPFNNDEYVIQTESPILLHNNYIQLYSIAPIHFNIGGISPVKDFSFNVLDANNDIFKLTNIDTQYIQSYNDENVISFNCKYNDILTLDVNSLYQVTEGMFSIDDKRYTIGEFIPFGSSRVKGIDSLNSLIIYNNIDNYFSIESRVDSNYSFENLNDYGINLYNKVTNIPLITPTLCKWNINGNDIFGNKIKEICPKSKNQNIDILYSDINNLGFSTFKYTNDNLLYVYNNPNDIIKNKNKSLIDSIIDDEISILSLFSNNIKINNKFSTLFYNKDNNTLETIFSGKKISLEFKKINNIFKYNGYMFSIINCHHSKKSNNEIEILINDNERILLIINYINSGSGLLSSNNHIIDNIYEENETTVNSELPFIILNNDILLSDVINNDNKYIPISNELKIDNDSSINIFIAALTDNNNNTYKKQSYTYDIRNIKNDNIFKYYINTNDPSIKVIKSIDSSLNIENDHNIRKTYNNVFEYIINPKQSLKNYNEYNIKNIENINNKLYIINDKMTYSNIVNIRIFELYDKIENNKHISNCSFYANPDFTDIITYNNMENNNINSLIGTTLIASNTNIDKVNKIKQLWINKKFTNTINDSSIKIDCIFDYDTTLTQWNNIYRIYNSDDSYNIIKGYHINDANRLFFGSVAPVLNNEYIELKKWSDININIDNEKYNTLDKTSKKYLIKINITDSLLNFIKNDTNFININWENESYEYIDEYIKNLLSYYYIINNKNIIKLFRCYNSNVNKFNKFTNYDDNASYEICDNITFNVINDNNQYYLKFELPFDNYQYAIKYKIIK